MTSVAMLLMQDMRLDTIVHPSSLPCTFDGWWIIGPTPCALTMHHMKNIIPAVGATIAFSVNRCRLQRIRGSIYATVVLCNLRLHFVNREPDSRQRYQPEQEKAHEISRSGPRRYRQRVCWYMHWCQQIQGSPEKIRTDIVDTGPNCP